MADNTLVGLSEVVKNFDKLAKGMQKTIVRRASRKSMEIVQTSAKANTKAIDDPKTREKIWRNIVIRSGKSNDKNIIRVRVGVLGGAKGWAAASGEIQGGGKNNPGGDTFYWRFVELGTSEIAAVPFLRRALSMNTAKVTDDFADRVSLGINQTMGGS